MKLIPLLLTFAFTFAFTPVAAEAAPKKRALASPKYISAYSKVADKSSCQYQEQKDEEGETTSCTYRCNGPVEGISTQLDSCEDYDNFAVLIGDKRFSTWEQMTKVGGFAGLGNEKSIVEWLGRPVAQGFADPFALIVRFNGTDENQKTRSRLAVFGIEKDALCFKGLVKDNVAARKMADTGACVEKIKPGVN